MRHAAKLWSVGLIAAITLMDAFTGASSAQAAIVSGSITGGSALGTGSFVILDPNAGPFTVGFDNFNTNNLYAFAEQENVLLTSDLVLDVGGTIAAGSRVNSYLVLFDPLLEETVSGIVTFGEKVLGVDRKPASLIATNGSFGASSVTYQVPASFALEPGLDFVNSGKPDVDSVRLVRLTSSTPGDLFRVFTLSAPSVPEPASWAMMIGGFTLAGIALRGRRRENDGQSLTARLG